MLMERSKIRVRILCEYYQDEYSENDIENSADVRVRNMDIPDGEKNAAERWLIRKHFVEGSIQQTRAGPVHSIVGIEIGGIDFVESVMNSVFIEINGGKDISQLSKSDRAKKFIQEFLKNSEISIMAGNAIIKFLKSININ